MVRKKETGFNEILFLVGLGLSVLYAIGKIPQFGVALLAIVGLTIGYFNISKREWQGFLGVCTFFGIVLLLLSLIDSLISGVPIAGTIFSKFLLGFAIVFLFAGIPVALKYGVKDIRS